MTTVTERPAQEESTSFLRRPIGGSGNKSKPKSEPKSGKLGIPSRPQVNLLPAEVISKRQVAVVQRRMVWVIFATIIVIAVAYGAAFLVRSEADLRLQSALTTSDELMQQRRQYSPVVQVINDIGNVQEARDFVLSTEVNWASYVYALAAVLPDGVTIDTLNVESISPGAELQVGADALTADGVGMLTFTATSPDLPEASEWIDALESIPGLVDANLQSSTLRDDSGEESYQVSVTVQVNNLALANRTFPDQEVDESAATDEAGAGDESTGTEESAGTDEAGE